MPHNFDPNQNYYSFIDNKTNPLVFIHGVGLNHKMWEPQISSFNDYSIITYDLLGHGKTPFNDEIVIAIGGASSGRAHARTGDRYQDMKEMGLDPK